MYIVQKEEKTNESVCTVIMYCVTTIIESVDT